MFRSPPFTVTRICDPCLGPTWIGHPEPVQRKKEKKKGERERERLGVKVVDVEHPHHGQNVRNPETLSWTLSTSATANQKYR